MDPKGNHKAHAPAVFDRPLYEKYDVPGPRYTSYPTAPHFHAGVDAEAYAAAARRSNDDPVPRPLSLYVHIPFCHSLCYYCACNKIITRHREKAEIYLHYLERELALQAALFDRDRPLRQLHLGGGTPTFMDDRQLWRLMQAISRHFSLAPPREREFSIEIDPRAVGPGTMQVLGGLGFNRMSLGVQDFDPAVQAAVNRVQPAELVQGVIEQGRAAGMASLSLDLIYGLPHQSVATFDATLDEVLSIRPDRLSVYNYAHLPERVKAQRLIARETLPSPQGKLAILEHTVGRLTDAGYVAIGLDHFALPGSDLAQAMDNNTLQRNFQGYSTHAECDLVAVGATAIGNIGAHYSQNASHLRSYYALLDSGQIPVVRGCELGFDDRLRRAVIERLMCRTWVDAREIERLFGIHFSEYFEPELKALAPLEADGLLQRHSAGIRVLPTGRLLLRNIAMVFDRYLHQHAAQVRYSRTV
ncbi:oxygen-independent coproporphyrinogen III oxidase [Aquisalimonas sp.]|uniref:oxygen-independent coproporphyrinogen III oxidase n=1 Tax=Aquisalimonas sp. TaxID=1872621 RepID=UPI0025C357FF|nr:oxygen-independent coproporphyrinogen III oxidase [Aquisalimonas sp.]